MAVDNGELVNDGKGAYLTTDKDYGDIELLIDYKTVPKADSGIYLRATPQVQIWDSTKEGGKWELGADKGSGGLWNNSPGTPGKDPLVLADKPFGQWNTLPHHSGRRAHAPCISTTSSSSITPAWRTSGTRTSCRCLRQGPDPAANARRRNSLAQYVHPRDSRRRGQCAPAQARRRRLSRPCSTARTSPAGPGPIENYEVKDGAIVCKPKKGGNIYTKEEYRRLRRPPRVQAAAGRQQWSGHSLSGQGPTRPTSACARCRSSTIRASKYAKLDPRQFNGSAYGMVPAQRGYLRPIGEWNFMEVTVQGPTIQVELNGTRILDADLSKVTEFKDNKRIPARIAPSGHFGFAGHNDPVEFRHIQIKRLVGK